MSHGNVAQSARARSPETIAAEFPIDADLRDTARMSWHRSGVAYEQVLCNADRGAVQREADIACDTEAGGVKRPVAIDHEDVGLRVEQFVASLDAGEFPVRQISWNIGKRNANDCAGGLHDLAARLSHNDGRGGRLVPRVREIETCNVFGGFEVVRLADPLGEPPLLVA